MLRRGFVLELHWRDGGYRRPAMGKTPENAAPMSAQSLTERKSPNTNAPCGSAPACGGVVSVNINGSAGLIASSLDFCCLPDDVMSAWPLLPVTTGCNRPKAVIAGRPNLSEEVSSLSQAKAFVCLLLYQHTAAGYHPIACLRQSKEIPCSVPAGCLRRLSATPPSQHLDRP